MLPIRPCTIIIRVKIQVGENWKKILKTKVTIHQKIDTQLSLLLPFFSPTSIILRYFIFSTIFIDFCKKCYTAYKKNLLLALKIKYFLNTLILFFYFIFIQLFKTRYCRFDLTIIKHVWQKWKLNRFGLNLFLSNNNS
jgi:hypothetical protein